MRFLPFNKPFIVGRELENIKKAVKDGHLSGDGPFSRQCQLWLETTLGTKKALLTHSCTAALEMAALLCNIKPGDEVIMPSYTFVSTANAFVLRGGVPVFVDIEPHTMNMDHTRIRGAITDRTRAIVPVHYAGHACAMDEIMDMARDYRLFVIEDAAQALLAQYKGKALGTIGHLGALSFHETKNIISGEGGALLVNDPDLIDRAEILREKGTNRNRFFRGEVDKYTWVDLGSSFLPSELTAAFLWSQFEQAQQITSHRHGLHCRYGERLMPLARDGHIVIHVRDKATDSSDNNGHLFYILTRSLDERNQLIHHLNACEIKSVFHYIPLHSSPAGKRFGRVSGSMDHTENLSGRVLRLPLFHEMTYSDVDHVCDAVMAFYQRRDGRPEKG